MRADDDPKDLSVRQAFAEIDENRREDTRLADRADDLRLTMEYVQVGAGIVAQIDHRGDLVLWPLTMGDTEARRFRDWICRMFPPGEDRP